MPAATPAPTRFELVSCPDCGHSFPRPKGPAHVLPCGKCGQGRMLVSELLAEPASVQVDAAVSR